MLNYSWFVPGYRRHMYTRVYTRRLELRTCVHRLAPETLTEGKTEKGHRAGGRGDPELRSGP